MEDQLVALPNITRKHNGRTPVVRQEEELEERPIIADEYNVWYNYISFLYFWPLYFGITMTDHPPQNQWDVNMVEGCHNGWYGQYLAAILLWNLFWLSQADDIGMTRIKFV